MIIQDSPEQLAKEAARIITERIEALLQQQDLVIIAIPGGRSVSGIIENLKGNGISWSQTRWFLLDERLVPLDDPESNYLLIKNHLGEDLAANILEPFIFTAEDPMQGVKAYQEKLDQYGGRFDIVVASSGEDGHIGSIFPGHDSVKSSSSGYILVNDSPKPPSARVSASPALIGKADTGILLFLGAAKKDALGNFFDQALSREECPAKIIRQLPCYHVLTDQEVDES